MANLAGANLAESFSASQADPNAPYTNTGGLNQAATLTLATSAAGVVVTEAANAIQETTEPIALVLSGPGDFQFQGANAYSGGTTIEGGELELGANTSAGTGEIAFAANAYATLILDSGVDPANTIFLPDPTDAIDFAALPFAFGDHLVLVTSGMVSTYALETAGGAVLETLNLTGAFDASSLIAGGDGAGGTEIAASTSALAAASNEASILGGSTRIFITDTAANFATYQTAITALIADGKVASVFTNNAALSDGSTAVVLTVVGGGDAINFSGSGDSASLSSTGSNWDTVNGSNGTVTLNAAKASVLGGSDTVVFAGSGDAASLYNTAGAWDTVKGSNGWIGLTKAQASVIGGGDTVSLSGDPSNAASLYNTAGAWDNVKGSHGWIGLTEAQASVTGGGDTVSLSGDPSNAASLYNTAGAWNTVKGSNGWIGLTKAQASVTGGGDTINLSGDPSNAASLYSTAGVWDTVKGSHGWISLTKAQASVNGGGDTVNLSGDPSNAASLYNTAGVWDTVKGSHRWISLTKAQASVNGGGDTVNLSGDPSNAA